MLNGHWIKYGCWILIPQLHGLFHLAETAMEGFQGEGHVEFVKSDDQPQNAQVAIGFRLQTDGRRWMIRLDPVTPMDFDYIEASFDGEQVYYVRSFETHVKKRREDGKKTGFNTETAWVYKGELLHNQFAHWIKPIWLAYASGSYFRSLTNDMVEPAMTYWVSGDTYDHDNPFKQRAQWTLSDSPPKLPTEVIYFSDGIIRGGRPSSPIQLVMAAPYDVGYTNAIYRVAALTNIGGLRIPLKSTLTTFGPIRGRGGGSASDLQIKNAYNISLLKGEVSAPGVMAYRPELPKTAIVSDARFAEVGDFPYRSPGHWPSEEEVRSWDVYKMRLLGYAGLPRDSSLGTTLAKFALFCLLLAPALFLLTKRWQSGKRG